MFILIRCKVIEKFSYLNDCLLVLIGKRMGDGGKWNAQQFLFSPDAIWRSWIFN